MMTGPNEIKSIALGGLDLLAALAEKLTGEYPLVALRDEDGYINCIQANPSNVKWISDPASVAILKKTPVGRPHPNIEEK